MKIPQYCHATKPASAPASDPLGGGITCSRISAEGKPILEFRRRTNRECGRDSREYRPWCGCRGG